MALVAHASEVALNLKRFSSYKESERPSEVDAYKQMLAAGNQFVCMKGADGWLFSPSRFSGYVNNTLGRHRARLERDGRVTTKQLNHVLGPYEFRPDLDHEFEKLCRELGIEPKLRPLRKGSDTERIPRGYWLLLEPVNASLLPPFNMSSDEAYPEDLTDEAVFQVGATRRVVVNAYERDPAARAACIEAFEGAICQVCWIDFGKKYGDLGQGFIHVHHRYPEQLRQPGYKIRPSVDLVPVCPNCHSMLHRNSDPPMPPEELREILLARDGSNEVDDEDD